MEVNLKKTPHAPETPWKITFLSVMPSPYVQDVYAALAKDPRIDLNVWYLEQEAPDTHWGEQAMPPYARVLPGRWIGISGGRVHYNPTISKELIRSDAELFVIVGYIGLTNQIAMRRLSRQKRPWAFWGEIPGLHQRGMLGNWIRRRIQSPLRDCAGIAAVGSHAVTAYQKLLASLGRESLSPSEVPGISTRRPAVLANIPYHCEIKDFQTAARARTCEETQGLGNRPLRFLYCGQLIARKGVDLMCEAFARLVDAGHNVTLTLAGEGPLREELQASLSPAVAKRVHFAGFQPVDELPSFFAQADVFLLPSRHDGWGVVVNQAVASGLPVIATDAVGAANDLVIPGENGFRIAAGSADALHQAMQHFVLHPADRIAFGRRSSKIAETISLDAAVEQWVTFFSSSLAQIKSAVAR